MADAKIADTKPAIVDLNAGTHFWCACGRSGNQPFCDGSHAGTGMTPLKFEIAEPRKAALCMCKRTENAPYCDGMHNEL